MQLRAVESKTGGKKKAGKRMRKTCFNVEFTSGGSAASCPVLHCNHLVTFMELLLGLLPVGYWQSPDCPHLRSELSFTCKCHHYCVPWALLSVQEAGPVFSLQLVLRAGSSPSSWAPGNSDREFSMLGPRKLGMSNNP